MSVKIGHASISENGTIRGKAGDQTGREVYTRNWYKHSKGWVTIRAKDPLMRKYIAEAMEAACKNSNIGYDQLENQTLWNQIKNKGFDPAKASEPCETDCARLVRVCCQYACEKVNNGVTIPDFYTASLKNTLQRTGLFDIFTSSKYTDKDNYLLIGDIQVTKTKGHTWVILSNGAKAEVSDIEPEKIYILGDRVLKNGCEGNDVKELQSYLIQLEYDLGKWGDDGEFGDSTEIAVRKFQEEHNCDVDGEVGPETLTSLNKALADHITINAKEVKIVGGNCYVRSAPNTNTGKILGTAREGDILKYQGQISENGWHLIEYKNRNGWVSGKYSKLVEK